MARARNIKPGLYKNEDLAECSIWARYLFPGLWCLADREGRQEDRPKRIKAELLPFDTQDVEPLLRELAEKKDGEGVPFIVRYRIDGVGYIQISKFSKHQTPHYTEKPSVIKPPPLQEKPPDTSSGNSGSGGGIKGGPLPPDSLIHRFTDSPNPDSPTVGHTGARTARSPRLNGKKPHFDPPEWIPRPQWDAWIEARTAKKKAPTLFALELAVAKLEELKGLGHHPAAVLAQSAFNGWTDLYAPKDVH